jgi:hypothetical protein
MSPTTGRVNLNDPVNRSNLLTRGLVAWWMQLPGRNQTNRFWDINAPGQKGRFLTLSNMSLPGTTTSGWGGGYNGLQTLQFDGTNDIAETTIADAIMPRPYTVIAAYTPLSLYAAGGKNFFGRHDAATNNGVRIQTASATAQTSLTLTFGAVADYPFSGLTHTIGVRSFCAVVVPVNSGTATAWQSAGGELRTATASVGTMGGTPTRVTISSELFSNAYHFHGGIEFMAIVGGAITTPIARGWHDQWRRGFPDMLRRESSVRFVRRTRVPVLMHHYRQQGAV